MRRIPLLPALLVLPLLIAPVAPYAAAPAAPAVDPQLLEFLADWQGADGHWVDPMTFARIDPAKIRADDARRGQTHEPAPEAASAPSAEGQAR